MRLLKIITLPPILWTPAGWLRDWSAVSIEEPDITRQFVVRVRLWELQQRIGYPVKWFRRNSVCHQMANLEPDMFRLQILTSYRCLVLYT